ncbi:hypothetical protein ACEQ8H_001016 [Pleosporales sp. CAS-2024a]
MTDNLSADEHSNYEIFRDCLGEPVLQALAMPNEKPKRKKKPAKKRLNEETGTDGTNDKKGLSKREVQPSDAEELGEFYLSSVIFPCFPPDLRCLTYPKYRDSVLLQDTYSTPLSASTYTHLVDIVSGDAIDSLESYGLLPPASDATDQRNFLRPVLNAYVTAVTAPPPGRNASFASVTGSRYRIIISYPNQRMLAS